MNFHLKRLPRNSGHMSNLVTKRDKIFFKDRSRNSPVGIANLFNEHFYNQFSESSSYDIEIDFNNDIFNKFNISAEAVYNLLKNLNPNKSPGPDKISGHLLTN